MGNYDWPTIKAAADKLSRHQKPRRAIKTLLNAIEHGDSDCKIRAFCWLRLWRNKLDAEEKKILDALKRKFSWQAGQAKTKLKQTVAISE